MYRGKKRVSVSMTSLTSAVDLRKMNVLTKCFWIVPFLAKTDFNAPVLFAHCLLV